MEKIGCRFNFMDCQSREILPTCQSVPHTETDCLAWLKRSACLFKETIYCIARDLSDVTTSGQRGPGNNFSICLETEFLLHSGPGNNDS